jgi:LL-diaminopimelate aminotransferase
LKEAKRLASLPPYLFARIEEKLEEAKKKGIDVINLGIGDPDQPTPEHIIQALITHAQNPENHRYPTSKGLLAFRSAVARWYQRRFGVGLDPDSEVVTLIGSKEGIAHISFCYLEEGDVALVPDPGYPVYSIGSALAGAENYIMPLKEENGFLPNLADIPSDVAKKAKLMFLNYPNNPTGAVAEKKFFREVVEFARNYNIIVCHDAAYTEITFGDFSAPSFLEVEGAKEVGIEFHSLSKTYNMTGWRLGWAVGNPEVIRALATLKSNLDSGVFQAIQLAGIAALEGPQDCVEKMRRLYQERRDAVIEGLQRLGCHLEPPKATIYVWVPVPGDYTSTDFAELVLEKAGVVITPGIGYGKFGEGYFRISLTVDKERIQEGLKRIEQAFGKLY